MTQPNANEVYAEGMEGNTRPTFRELSSNTSAHYWTITHHLKTRENCAALLDDAVDKLVSMKNAKWVVAQVEETKSGNPHIQACMGYTRSERMFAKLRKAFPGCHIEVCRNWRNAQSYCSKDESRICDTVYWPEEIKDEINPWRGEKKYEVKAIPGPTPGTDYKTKREAVKYENTQEYKDWDKEYRKTHKINMYKCHCTTAKSECRAHMHEYDLSIERKHLDEIRAQQETITKGIIQLMDEYGFTWDEARDSYNWKLEQEKEKLAEMMPVISLPLPKD
ncbi:Rep [uncultured virus]|uniref:Rep n=1 Tax=uncultured virus TaxID=340016 RepID=A0A2K9LSK7_9VIRU|nr:Rep [uncultured virus]